MILVAGILHNYGGSDEALEMIIAMACKALFHMIGLDISHSNLAKGCQSCRTISRYELNLAAECVMKVILDIKEDGVKEVGVIMDHGHHVKQDHFVNIIGLDTTRKQRREWSKHSV